jgi:hypothetical protein
MECHPHDLKWIKEQLQALPPTLRIYAAQKYSEAFAKSQNRRECNTRLREYIEKIKNKEV